MENKQDEIRSKAQKEYSRHIERKTSLKLKARRENKAPVWFGLGMMGMIGWSIVLPTLLGIALGRWLDVNHSGSYSWTLMLLAAGLALGCLNAWHWIKKEEKAINETTDTEEVPMKDQEENTDD
ncbi:MAG: AtpZ/AtpI family protein [Peptostreptococcaceae bacterium]|nr:AtpZ/AtpI family protein [Peptostreptococcaceae bacterium]